MQYRKCYIKVVTWTCLEFYQYICTLPWVLHIPRIVHIHVHVSVKPLTAVSQPINVQFSSLIATHIHNVTKHITMFKHSINFTFKV